MEHGSQEGSLDTMFRAAPFSSWFIWNDRQGLMNMDKAKILGFPFALLWYSENPSSKET